MFETLFSEKREKNKKEEDNVCVWIIIVRVVQTSLCQPKS